MERVFQSWELNRQPLRWGKHLNNTHLTLKHESKSWHGDDCTEIMSLKPKKTEGNAIIKNARPLLDILIIFERNLNLKQTHFFLKRFPMYITATCRENFDKSRFRVTEHNADISYHQSQVHGSLQIEWAQVINFHCSWSKWLIQIWPSDCIRNRLMRLSIRGHEDYPFRVNKRRRVKVEISLFLRAFYNHPPHPW